MCEQDTLKWFPKSIFHLGPDFDDEDSKMLKGELLLHYLLEIFFVARKNLDYTSLIWVWDIMVCLVFLP